MKSKDLSIEIRGDQQEVAIVRLTRPAKRNALNDGLVEAIRKAFENMPATVSAAARSKSFLREMPGSRLSGGSTKACSVTPTASTMTKRVFTRASGVTEAKSAEAMVRAPRPFICS